MASESESNVNERADKACEVLRDILGYMTVEADVTVTAQDDHILLTIESRRGGLVIGKKGQTLDALQFLVARIVGRTHPGEGRILVDADGYRERRAEQLRAMAHQVAQRVREELVPYAFDPSLNSAERRIVHMELKDEPDLSTRSEGEGEDRRLVVYPGPAD